MGMLVGTVFSHGSGGGGGGPSEAQKLSTDITSAFFADGKGSKKRAFTGFDAGVEPKNLAGFGSIVSGAYNDGDEVARTVQACYLNVGGQASNWTDSLWVSIGTGSPADVDAVFSKIVIDGVEFARADATTTAAQGTSRWWRWDFVFPPDPFAGANPDAFELWAI